MISIIDYGMGNLRSVQKALEFLGQEAEITASPARLDAATHVILPGVGAFADAIGCLRRTGLDRALKACAAGGKPVLGICLGMQLFYETSEENGEHEGLGLLKGRVTRLKAPGLKVPHMGWNSLCVRESPLFRPGETPCVYFVHSYAVAGVSEDTAASCEYGETFTAASWRGNVLATQFHPEKSGSAGLEMLRRFAAFRG